MVYLRLKYTADFYCLSWNEITSCTMRTEKVPVPDKCGAPEAGMFSEKISEHFPIRYTEEVAYGEEVLAPEDGSIVHYFRGLLGGGKLHRFRMSRVIDGLHYIFILAESFGGSYGLSFKTEEYEYATTNLSKNGRETLAQTVSGFLESIGTEYPDVQQVNIHPADAAYSTQEVEACTDAILISPQNVLTREEISAKYKGHDVFDLYYRLYNKDFPAKYHNKRPRHRGRARFFKTIAQRYLSDWVVDGARALGDFSLKRKENGNSATS